MQTLPYESVQIGSGNIAIQESDGEVYILYTDINNKLKFESWNGSKLEEFEPEIPLNNSEKPISRLFNLLSKQTKYEQYEINDLIADELYFASTANMKISVDQSYKPNGRLFTRILANDSILIIDSKIRLFMLQNDMINEVISEDISHSLEPYRSIYCIDNTTTTKSITIVVAYATADTPQINSHTANTVYIETYYIDIRGNITSSKNDPVKTSDTVIKGLVALPNGHAALHIDKMSANGDHTYAIRIVPGSTEINSAGWAESDYESALYACNIGFIDFNPSDDLKVNLYLYDDLLNPKSYELKFNERTPDRDSLAISATEQDIVIRDLHGSIIYYDLTETGWQGQAIYVPENVAEAESQYFSASNNAFNIGGTYTLDISSMKYIDTPTDTFRQISLKTGTIQEYTANNAYINSNLGATVYIAITNNEADIVYRKRIPKTVFIDRESSDNFPVLSEISDEVLTSFYLDNTYWFVTKHRIFGTGVANEQFTIKYFDPRKYFHFDEELTGAMRVSDSSFWVFHNKGAYLVYRSSSEFYDEISGEYIEMITWLCTSTAESKGCDFENAVITLPVNNYVACVTSDDISVVQMRENVQTDDRILIPITLDIRKFVASLLEETKDIVTGTFKYNALFFLNPENENNNVSVLVYNTTTEAWWYWKLPVSRVQQAKVTENNIELLAKTGDKYILYDLYTDYYQYTIGGLTWEIYADRLFDDQPSQIEWFWESAILHFNTTDYKKQLLYTNFTFGERDSSTVSFEYNFEVYDEEYSERNWSDVTQVVERVKTYSCKNIIAKFMYLQLYLKNTAINDTEFDAYTRPKFSAISFKYRILPGGLL